MQQRNAEVAQGYKHKGLYSNLQTYVKLGIVACVYNPSAPAGKWEVENMELPQKPTGQTVLQMPQINRTCLKGR